jgi:hypothetical protein
MISHNNVGDLSLTVNQKTDLAAYIMGESADIASKFKCNEELGWKAAPVEIFKPADLAGLKPAGIPEQFFHLELTLTLQKSRVLHVQGVKVAAPQTKRDRPP